jgi:hypothetical protein
MYTRRQRPAVCADELRTDEASGVAAVPGLVDEDHPAESRACCTLDIDDGAG